MPPVKQQSGSLRPVISWCLPTYAVVGIALVLALMSRSLPLRVQIGLSDAWMIVALVLPVTTLVAAVKAASVKLPTTAARRQIWRPVLGWCMVAAALLMNVFCYAVIARVLR